MAAAGVKVYAPDLDGAIPGSPVEVIEDFERDSKGIEAQFKSVIFQKKDEAGAVLRADSLGSVEALLQLLKDDPAMGAKLMMAIAMRIAARLRDNSEKLKKYVQLTSALQQEIDHLTRA